MIYVILFVKLAGGEDLYGIIIHINSLFRRGLFSFICNFQK